MPSLSSFGPRSEHHQGTCRTSQLHMDRCPGAKEWGIHRVKPSAECRRLFTHRQQMGVRHLVCRILLELDFLGLVRQDSLAQYLEGHSLHGQREQDPNKEIFLASRQQLKLIPKRALPTTWRHTGEAIVNRKFHLCHHQIQDTQHLCKATC
mmetsp:Transcript_27595/g.91621  ORF Transcript_27595/g.91621 Transcript_27595/m.91621 type:complete len:151 (-) Transcript_27595:374-826(-)